ncbi:MAG: hypothetical protein IIC01_05960 [Planctomycetes bacterium]|nr:hypothetical protein [Planctomycetota bacterium]
MARIQQGVNAITVWMIVFVALWLTSTVFLVIMYTGQEDLNTEIARLTAANERLISPQQERSLELVRPARSAAEGGPTVVGLLEDARDQTAMLATGEGSDDPATVRTKRDELLRIIRSERTVADPDAYDDVSFQVGMTRLYEAFKAENSLRRTSEQRMGELEAEVTTLVADNAAMKEDFDRRAQDMTEQLNTAETKRAAYRQGRDESVDQLEREFERRRGQNDADLTNERRRRAQCQEKLTEAQERYLALREKLGGLLIGPEELATARQPDGLVLTAIPGDPVVYINLGRKDSIVPGLRFAVYSAETGIPEDGRAKAAIEVVSISNSSSECRIRGVARNDVILEGDLIGNPIYDPAHPLSFVVLGEFDLDRDGLPDRSGAAAIGAMVQDWGGRLLDELTPLTDFVVVGAAPPRPRQDADVPPDELDHNNARRRAWDHYTQTLETAKSLAVPVLTQDVFLNFLGYAPRGRYP